jgi:hypothetical protein
MSLHHTDAPACPLCEEKLRTAHSVMADWFRRIKKQFENVHISWAYRGAEDQERFFKEGKTRCRFPKSAHNYAINGKPCSLALDLFLIDEDGSARFPPLFYAKVNEINQQNKEPIRWGRDV